MITLEDELYYKIIFVDYMEIYSRFVISSFSVSVLMLNLRRTIYSYYYYWTLKEKLIKENLFQYNTYKGYFFLIKISISNSQNRKIWTTGTQLLVVFVLHGDLPKTNPFRFVNEEGKQENYLQALFPAHIQLSPLYIHNLFKLMDHYLYMDQNDTGQ